MPDKKQAAAQVDEKVKDGKFQKLNRMGLSLIIAIVVWIVIINIVNPTINVKIQDVPVRYIGENVLRERGLVLVNKYNLPKFDVKVIGTRRELMRGREKIRVDIDVSGIHSHGNISINPSVSGPESFDIEKKNFSSVALTVEPSYEKQIPIFINQTGDEQQKEKGKIVFSTPGVDQMQIVGSKSDISMVYGCVATIDVSGIEESGETMYSYSLIDSDKNVISVPPTVYCSSVTVPVNNTIYDRKTCPVNIRIPEYLSENYIIDIDEKSISPSKIDIGVSEGGYVPDEINATFKDGDYKPGTGEFVLETEVADGIFIQNPTVSVKAEITKLEEKKAKVHVKIINIPEGLKAASDTVEYDMTLLVPENYDKEIKATADASDAGVGMADLRIKFDDKKIKATEGNTINVYFEGVNGQ